MKIVRIISIAISLVLVLNSCLLNSNDKRKNTSPVIRKQSTETRKQFYKIQNKSIEGYVIGDLYSQKSTDFEYKRKLTEFQTDEGVDTLDVVSVSDKDGKLFDVVLFENRIYRIIIRSDRCKTNKGTSINSTLKDFVGKYPDFHLLFSYISNSFFVTAESIKGVNFFIDSKYYKGSEEGLYDRDMVEVDIKDFADGAKIHGIEIL